MVVCQVGLQEFINFDQKVVNLILFIQILGMLNIKYRMLRLCHINQYFHQIFSEIFRNPQSLYSNQQRIPRDEMILQGIFE